MKDKMASASDSDIDEVVPVRGSVREPRPRRAFSPISSSTPLREPGSPAAASRSPDTASPIYPDRAIRPLPRSRLKSRLSPEQASTIVYPPAPPPLSPTLRFGPDGRSRPIDPATGLPAGHARGSDGHDADRGWDGYHDEHVHADEAGCTHVCTCGEDVDSGDDEVEFDHPDYRYHPPTHPHPGPPLVPSMNGKPMDAIQRRLVEASKNGARPPSLPHGGSLASSADGYESFENTSNKKKRKIPLSSANSSLQQHQLSAEMANMGLNGGLDGAADDGGPVPVAVQHQAPHHLPNAHAAPAPLATASGTGISGAGRGRYGRQNGYGRNGERRPLGNSMSGGNGSYAPPRSGAAKNDLPNGIENNSLSPDSNPHASTGGIISQAIKSAAEAGPLTPPKHSSPAHAASAKPTSSNPNASNKTQFTFSCESESASKMEQQAAAQQAAYAQAQAQANAQAAAYQQQRDAAYAQAAYHTPGSYPAPAGSAGYAAPMNGRAAGGNGHVTGGGRVPAGTQTPSNMRQGAGVPPTTGGRPPPPPAGGNPGAPLPPNQHQQQPPPPKPKPRRRPSKEYALAARQRQLQQEYTNYHHRPTKDNIWICEFCEYEDIFGVPPLAMIRRYEIKDRQERKKAEEKRRLLEKARAKGRKGKKGKGKNNGAANQQNPNNPAGAPPGANGQQPGSANGYAHAADDPNYPPPAPGEEEFYDEEGEYSDEAYGDEYEPTGPDEAGFYPPPPPIPPAGTPQQAIGVGGRGGTAG